MKEPSWRRALVIVSRSDLRPVVQQHIEQSASSKEAARALGISPRTIDVHRANLLKKLGAKNTVDLLHRVLGE